MRKYTSLSYLLALGVIAVMAVAIFSVVVMPSASHAQVYTTSAASALFTRQLDIGSRGNDVIQLQIMLATDPSIYPEGLVTGYFGRLTARAVARFQAFYGLPTAARVGPLTLAKLNSLGIGGSVDTRAPVISNVTVMPNPAVSSSAIFYGGSGSYCYGAIAASSTAGTFYQQGTYCYGMAYSTTTGGPFMAGTYCYGSGMATTGATYYGAGTTCYTSQTVGYNPLVTVSSPSATIVWATDEDARGKVFFSPAPLPKVEAASAFSEPVIGGQVIVTAGYGRNHSVILTGLARNTFYYYIVEAIDVAGNVTVTTEHLFKTI